MSNNNYQRNELYKALQELYDAVVDKPDTTLVGVRLNNKEVIMVTKRDLNSLIEAVKLAAE